MPSKSSKRYYPSQVELQDPSGTERVLKTILDTLYEVQANQNRILQRPQDTSLGSSSLASSRTEEDVDRVQVVERIQQTFISGEIDLQIQTIRDALQSGGNHPLYIGGLSGEAVDPQRAKIPATTNPPVPGLGIDGEVWLYHDKTWRYNKGLAPGRFVGLGWQNYARHQHRTITIPSGTTANQLGGGTLTTASSSVTAAGNFAHYVNAAASHAGWAMPTAQSAYTALGTNSDVVIYHCHMRLDDDNGYANVRYWFGLTAANGAVAPTTVTMMGSDTPAVDYAAFRLSTSAGDTTWQCVVDSGSGSPTAVSSQVTVASGETGTEFELEIHWQETRVDFFINNLKVGSVTTTLPDTALGWIAMGKSSDGTSRGPLLRSVVVEF